MVFISGTEGEKTTTLEIFIFHIGVKCASFFVPIIKVESLKRILFKWNGKSENLKRPIKNIKTIDRLLIVFYLAFRVSFAHFHAINWAILTKIFSV